MICEKCNIEMELVERYDMDSRGLMSNRYKCVQCNLSFYTLDQEHVVEVYGILAWTQHNDWKEHVEQQVSKILNQDIRFEQLEIIEKELYNLTSDTACSRVTVRVSGVDLTKLTTSAYRKYVKTL